MTERKTWYFTFGIGHPMFADRYVVFHDLTSAEARARMMQSFGRQWAFQYDDELWHECGISQADKYGLTELTAA